MLYKETVSEETMEMIHQLMDDPTLKDFFLVGGTSLALQLGHRKSEDIDLFSTVKFDQQLLSDHFGKYYDPDLILLKTHGISVTIGRENIDLWHYPVALIKEPVVIENIRMWSKEDVSAMKINSIVFKGDRVKDYSDIYALLEQFSLNNLKDVYAKKYPDLPADEHVKEVGNHSKIERFKVEMTDSAIGWEQIVTRLKEAVEHPDKRFGVSAKKEELKEEKKKIKRKGKRP